MKTTYQKIMEAMEREGDPGDQHLNHTEEQIILPLMQEVKLRNVTCKKENDVLQECSKKYGGLFNFICVMDRLNHGICVFRNRGSEDIFDDCVEEYVALRTRYRSTKDPNILERMKSMVYPSRHKYNE